MWIEISVAAAVFFFALLSLFAIRTLITTQKTLDSLRKQVEFLTQESLVTLRATEQRLRFLDPFLRTFSNLGEVCEKKTEQFKQSVEVQRPARNPEISTEEVMEWLVLSTHLYQSLFKKRR